MLAGGNPKPVGAASQGGMGKVHAHLKENLSNVNGRSHNLGSKLDPGTEKGPL